MNCLKSPQAVVDILDSYELDCDQKTVTRDLIDIVQPTKERAHIKKFREKTLEVTVWEKKSPSKLTRIRFSILTQKLSAASCQDVGVSGPGLTKEELMREHHTGIVAVWRIELEMNLPEV